MPENPPDPPDRPSAKIERALDLVVIVFIAALAWAVVKAITEVML